VTQQAARDVNVPARRRPVQRTITQLARRFLVHQAAPRFTPRQCGLAARTLLKLQGSWVSRYACEVSALEKQSDRPAAFHM